MGKCNVKVTVKVMQRSKVMKVLVLNVITEVEGITNIKGSKVTKSQRSLKKLKFQSSKVIENLRGHLGPKV